jgi:hypothetical protein
MFGLIGELPAVCLLGLCRRSLLRRMTIQLIASGCALDASLPYASDLGKSGQEWCMFVCCSRLSFSCFRAVSVRMIGAIYKAVRYGLAGPACCLR